MDILQLLPSVYGKFALFALIFIRIIALLTTFALFRRELITARIMVSLATILSFYVLLWNYPEKLNFELFSMQMLLHGLFQFFIGFCAGFVLNIILEIFIALGQVISMQVGLGMASLIDPRFGYITSLSHFYLILGTLTFLYLNGHLFAIQMVMESFMYIPLQQASFDMHLLGKIANYSGVMFSGSIMLALTIIIVLLTTNIALAVMSKFAPQFNLFTIGINLQLIIGLIYINLIFSLTTDGGIHIINECLTFFKQLWVGMRQHV